MYNKIEKCILLIDSLHPLPQKERLQQSSHITGVSQEHNTRCVFNK